MHFAGGLIHVMARYCNCFLAGQKQIRVGEPVSESMAVGLCHFVISSFRLALWCQAKRRKNETTKWHKPATIDKHTSVSYSGN